ncbi:MAG: TonB-dependent receptor [Gemmatimonadota bacterium]
MFNRRSSSRRGLSSSLSLALAAFLGFAGATEAQQVGTVTGTVIDGTNMRPLNGAQVSIEGTSRGALADARGRFLITNVPAGTQSVRVTYLGYRTATEEIQVAAGATTSVEFALQVSAVAMDEVVVTGTAGAIERRRLGVSMGTVDMNQVQDLVPVEGIGQALQARIPSVRSIGTSGGVGAGRDLRIRGTSSFTLGQRPVVYIDGVRVDTRNTEWGGMSGVTCCAFSGGAGEDRLGDLNPDDIDRIEVLKGAAAATLYGSEASNGVIQIFTKRGRTGSAPQFTFNVGAGMNRHRPNFRTSLNPNFTGPNGFRALDANETLIENGLVNTYDMTIQGGGQDVTYFTSGSYSFEEGSIKPNEQTRGNLRLNLNWTSSDRWTFGVNSAYSRNNILSLQQANNWTALFGNAILGNPLRATEDRPYGEPWVSVPDIKKIDTFSDVNRWTGSVNVAFTPSQTFTHRVTVGLDNVTDQKERLMPFGSQYVYVGSIGERNIGYRAFNTTTLDYLGNLGLNFGGVGSDLSFGAQGYWENENVSMATGQGFAGPGVSTVSAASQFFAAEGFNETINLGFFAQNRFSFGDRLYVTVGTRVDGHSSFGTNFGLKAYPKVDAAYMISEEGFLPEFISSLKLRAAIGQAGLPPGAFDSFRTYSPNAVLDDVSGVSPQNPGNPDLKPETSTEIDAGFEAGLWDDRVGMEVSAYRSVTTDALLAINLPPSMGYRPITSQSQLQNVGEILNTGWEVSINTTPVNTRNLRWSTVLNLDGSSNEIQSLGEAAINGRLGNHREGHSVGVLFGNEITGYNPATNRHTRSDTAVYQGELIPTFNLSWGNTLNLGDFRIYGLISAERGAVFNNGDRPYGIRQRAGDEYLRTVNADGSPSVQTDSLVNHWSLVGAFDKRDNIRIREVSLSYTVSEDVSGRIGLGRTSLSLSGQNLHWWDECNCMDPNMKWNPGDFNSSGFLATPQPRRFLFSLRTTF